MGNLKLKNLSKCKVLKSVLKMKDKKQPKGNLILILHFTPHQEAKDFLRLDIVNPIMHPGVK